MAASNRFLGIDYGSVRVGVAISDPLAFLARRLETIERQGSDECVIRRLLEIIHAYDVRHLVIGLPLRTDDVPGKKENEVRIFAQALQEASGIEPFFQDERYSTVRAQEIMQELAVKPQDRRQLVDQIAAEVILQDFLDEHSR